MNPIDDWLTPAEVAKRLRVSAETVRVLCRAGKLPAAKIGNQFRINAADLAAFVERSRVQPATPADANTKANPKPEAA